MCTLIWEFFIKVRQTTLWWSVLLFLVHEVGLEPTRPCEHRHLKPASLPIPPLVHSGFYRKGYTITREGDLSRAIYKKMRIFSFGAGGALPQHHVQQHHHREAGYDAHGGEVGLLGLVLLTFGDQLMDGH